MELYIGLFIVLVLNDFFNSTKVKIKDKIVYIIFLIISIGIAWIYFSNPFRTSLGEMLLTLIGR